MKNIFIFFLILVHTHVFGQKKKVACDSITCDYLVNVIVQYSDSSDVGDCLKMKVDTIVMVLYDKTPKHKTNFIKLAKEGYFNGTTFHRVIEGFMIQGGDPNSKDRNPRNDGHGGPDYTIPAEINPDLKHKRGAVSAARLSDNMNPEKESNGSQFFIVQPIGGTPHLDGGYTVFGEVLKGMNVVDKIAKTPKGNNDRPICDVKMTVYVEQIQKKRITELYGYQY